MNLDPEDLQRFYKLHKALMLFVNQRLHIVEPPIGSTNTIIALPPEARMRLRDALLQHMDLIDAFVGENPFGLEPAEFDIVRSWNDLVAGEFYVYRHLQKHTIFLTAKQPSVAYGVLALKDRFEDLIGPRLPYFCKTVLLPFKGQIVYDGILSGYNVIIGGNIRRELNDAYNVAKEQQGIITSLPPPTEIHRPARKNPRTRRQTKETEITTGDPSIPATVRSAYNAIVELTDNFCRQHLDDEYQSLCRRLAGALARKRPSPLLSGKPESWASGIVRVIGWVNFLGVPSQPGHMTMTDIDEGFGVSEATGASKSKAIRDLLKIHPLDPDLTLPSRMDQNPMVWMIEVNGMIVDARHLPREIQEEVYRKGLIPYVPYDRADESAKG